MNAESGPALKFPATPFELKSYSVDGVEGFYVEKTKCGSYILSVYDKQRMSNLERYFSGKDLLEIAEILPFMVADGRLPQPVLNDIREKLRSAVSEIRESLCND